MLKCFLNFFASAAETRRTDVTSSGRRILLTSVGYSSYCHSNGVVALRHNIWRHSGKLK